MEQWRARADRWSEGSHALIGAVEPEWWLRMMCGQLAEEDPFRTRTATIGLRWLGLLSRRNRRRIS
jgi:hypothetical protein